ncbi:MAG: hypothetical protein HN731_18715 [Rhodospirillaceae bacterium]|jgi:hypothetical protein|nr:hypothetical protein [Rhodospirillaceae bacterium]MBT7957238.1 hypothetical protein [Rhodospirillaceae bacterium]
MALTPRIAGTNMVPAGGGRFAATGAVANSDPAPLTELNQINALIYEGQSEFQYDQFNARQQQQQYARRRAFDHFGRPMEQTPERRVNNSMMGNSSESFAAAFDLQNHTDAHFSKGPKQSAPTTSLDKIIATYELTKEVIYDEIPPRGENISMVL